MKVNVENVSDSKKMIRVEIPADRVNAEFKKMFAELRKKAQIPGFRPGRVPDSVLRMRMGDDIAMQIGIDLIEETFKDAVKNIEEDTVGDPDFNDWKVEEGKSFSYEITIEILPPFELKNYKGIEVPKAEIEVTEDEIQAGLERVREGQSTFAVVEDRTAEKGDRIYGRLTLNIDDKPVPGWKNRHIEVDIGENKLFPDSEVETKFIGAASGTDHVFDLDFPEDYTYFKDMAGKTVSFSLTVNEIKVKEIPEINDDLAKDAGFETLDELRKMVTDDIVTGKKKEVEELFDNAIFDAIEKVNTIPAPEPMVQKEAEYVVDSYFSYQGKLPEDQKKSLAESMKPMAEKRVKQRLILQRIAELEEIDVTEEDLDKSFEEMAENEEEGNAAEIRIKWEEEELIPGLKKQLARSKAMTWLKENVKAVELVPEKEEVKTVKPKKKASQTKTPKKSSEKKSTAAKKTTKKAATEKKAPAEKKAAKKTTTKKTTKKTTATRKTTKKDETKE